MRFLKSFFAMLVCGVAATSILAYPQAVAVGTPDRGAGATAVVLTLFWSLLLVVIMLLAAAAANATVSLTAAVFKRPTGFAWLFLIGAAFTMLFLAFTPVSQHPDEIAGLLAGWIVAGGAGFSSIATDAGRPSIRWKKLGLGIALAAIAGLLALAHGSS